MRAVPDAIRLEAKKIRRVDTAGGSLSSRSAASVTLRLGKVSLSVVSEMESNSFNDRLHGLFCRLVQDPTTVCRELGLDDKKADAEGEQRATQPSRRSHGNAHLDPRSKLCSAFIRHLYLACRLGLAFIWLRVCCFSDSDSGRKGTQTVTWQHRRGPNVDRRR